MDVATQSSAPLVPSTYRHHRRQIESGPAIRLGSGSLKWYGIRRPESVMPPGLVTDAQAFLRAEVESRRLDIDGQPGFVILHLADSNGRPDSVALLMISTWRQANELWESVYVKPLDPVGEYRRVEKGDHSATYCVWELAAVWHERQAWSRYLDSGRDGEAEQIYLEDRFAGIV